MTSIDAHPSTDRSSAVGVAPGISRILLPLDRTTASEHAVGYATAIARASGATVDVVFVHRLDEMHLYGDERTGTVDEIARDAAYVRDVAARIALNASIPATHALLRGGVARSISARADDTGADLIVMASHGRTGLRRAWLGSVADEVVRVSRIPVLIVRASGERPPSALPKPFRSIVIPIDGSMEAIGVFDAVKEVARCSNATVHLVRVVRPVPIVMMEPVVGAAAMRSVVDGQATAALAAEASHGLALAANILRDDGQFDVTVTLIVEDDVPVAVLDFIRSCDADLIALTTHGRGASRVLVGSMADRILDHSRLPVLLQRSVRRWH